MLSSQCMNYVAIQLSCSRRSPTKRMMQHAKGNISATSIVSLKASASLDWLTVPTFGALCDGNVIQQSVICVSFATDIHNEQGIQRHVIIVCNWGFSIVDTRYMATNQSGCWAIPSCLDFISQLPVDIIVTTLISMPMMMVIKSCPYLQLSNLWRGCFTAASREDDNVDGVYKTSSLLRIGPWSLLQRNMAEWFCFCSFRRYTLNVSCLSFLTTTYIVYIRFPEQLHWSLYLVIGISQSAAAPWTTGILDLGMDQVQCLEILKCYLATIHFVCRKDGHVTWIYLRKMDWMGPDDWASVSDKTSYHGWDYLNQGMQQLFRDPGMEMFMMEDNNFTATKDTHWHYAIHLSLHLASLFPYLLTTIITTFPIPPVLMK